jgi:hypothetical protein
MPLKGSLKVVLGLEESKVADLATAAFTIAKEYAWKIANGTGAGQADLLFSDQRTLSAGANEDLDLAGVLASVYGATLTFVKLKGVLFKAADANPNAMSVSRPATTGVPLFGADGDLITLPPGAVFAWFDPTGAGVTVTAGTDDVLNVLAGAGGNHIYDVVIIGASA